jgi:lysophospholipase L1-like esterase
MYSKELTLQKSASTSVIAVAADVGSGKNPVCLCIGDSTTAGGVWTGELLTLLASDNLDATLIGTLGTAPNLHEGIGGKTLAFFYSDAASPFVFDGVFNFPAYMSAHSFASVDFIFMHLGINDVFALTGDTSVDTLFDANKTKIDAMITSFKAFNASVKTCLMVPIPPSTHQDAFGHDYGCGQTQWRYKANIHRYAKKLIDAYTGQEASGIYLIPVNCNLDTEHNMSTETVAVNSRNSATVVRQSNGVHPANAGYYQMADTVFYALKNLA